jgi:hypothetical protein
MAIKNHAFDNACLMVPPFDMLEFKDLTQEISSRLLTDLEEDY